MPAILQDSKWADYSAFESAAAAVPLPSDTWQQAADGGDNNTTALGAAVGGAAVGTQPQGSNASAATLHLDWRAAQALLAAANATIDRVVAALAS